MPKTSAPGSANTARLYFTPRLREAFTVIHARPLTVVEAPMGYGKTVAAREFLGKAQRKGTLRVVWTAIVGPSAGACWQTFCRELKNAAPELAETADALLHLGFPHDTVQAEAACQIVLDAKLADSTILVFDDTHLLSVREGAAFARFCELLAQSGMPNLRLMCISRSAWVGDKRELLSLKGILAVIGREVFALDPEEIRQYYANCNFFVSPDDARELHKATGGWISALYLCLLHYAKRGLFSTPEQVTEPLMRSLVEKEAYAPLSPALRKLLFTLAPLERFTARQADFLFGDDTRALLNELVCKNAFVFFDPERGIYAPHSIFSQHILALFSRLPEKRQKAIRRKCGDWFMAAGEIVSGMEAYCAAGEFEQALTALESDMSRHLVTEKAGFFNEMFKSCPEAILERHMGAAFKYAIAAFSAADFASFGAQLAWLAERCADKDASDSWRGELEVLRALAAFNGIEAMSAHHRKANFLLGRPTGLYGHESSWTLGCPSVLFMFHRESGRLGEALRQMHECMPHYYQLASNHGAGGEFLMQAEALYHAGRFDEAETLCHRAEARASEHTQLGNVLCALFLRLRLGLVAGKPEKAQGLIAAMRALITRSRDYFLLHTVDLCEGWLYAALGDRERIPAWVRSELAEDSRLYAFAKGWYAIVHGRALLLAGESARVIGLFGYLLEQGHFRNHMLFFIYAHIYLAAAYQGQDKEAQAVETLQKALDAALPDEIHMPFVENDDLLSPVFEMLAHGSPDERLKPIQALAERVNAAHRFMPELTHREQEVASLAVTAEDFSIDEIAERLHISPNTVKFHLKNTYQKTGTSSRLGLKEKLEP